MATTKQNLVNCLDEKDKDKLLFFAEILFKHSKYEKVRDEIEQRRKEVRENHIISHRDFWQEI